MFRDLPKAELHLHLGGAYPVDYVRSIATPQQRESLDKALKHIAGGVDYHECFYIFGLVSQIINSEERVEKGVEALCRSLKEDGVVYAEIRTGIKDLGQGKENYLLAVFRGMEKEISKSFHARLLLSLQRSSTPEFAKETIDLALKYRDRGIVGIDISGNSTIGQIESILPELLRAKDNGLFLTLHIGESPLESDQRWLLEKLQPHRIGHGVHLTHDAREWVLENKIPLEVCITSSILVKMIENGAMHPGLEPPFHDHPIAICTDDPLIFSTTLSDEFAMLKKTTSLPNEKIEQLARSSLDHAFLSDVEKERLRTLF